MKNRILAVVLTLGLALPILGLAAGLPEAPAAETVAVAAARNGRRWNEVPSQEAVGNAFIDENKDGICDYFGADKQGAGQGKNTNGANYIDGNQDGVCDNYGTDAQGQGAGQGKGAQGNRGNGKGMGANSAGSNPNGGRGGWRSK